MGNKVLTNPEVGQIVENGWNKYKITGIDRDRSTVRIMDIRDHHDVGSYPYGSFTTCEQPKPPITDW